MASKAKTPQPKVDHPVPAFERSEPITLGPDEGGNNVLAAWRGLVNLFGAECERFDVTPDGVVCVNFTTAYKVDRDTIIDAITKHGDKAVNRRLDLVELYPYVLDPSNVAPFTKSEEMTQWMGQFTKGYGDGDGSRSPQWVKDGIADYKSDKNIAAPRGRKRRIVRLDSLGEIKPETLEDTALSELQALQVTISQAIAARNAPVATA
jgi:hypothetical protein